VILLTDLIASLKDIGKNQLEADMKKTLMFLAIFAIAAFPALAETGNGSLSGAHYNLNIIGVQKDKTADMDGASGHTIFVKLDGKSKIMLAEGDYFDVLDRNATDNNGATFQLPNPDPDGDGVTVYSVYARALGKPDKTADITTCAYEEVVDAETGAITYEEICSLAVLNLTRTKGRQKFEDVSKQLLFIYADLDADGILERYSLFDDALQDYFWSYDNQGLKLVQLRFYEIPTDVP
jgi:hypothetical protein